MSSQGINQNINKKLGPFNNWTGQHDDACAVYNQQNMSTKPLKYYTNQVWNNDEGEKGVKRYTTVGNQKNFNEYEMSSVRKFGQPTSLRNKKDYTYVYPPNTSPFLGNASEDRQRIDTNSKQLNFGFGEATNLNNQYKAQISSEAWSPMNPAVLESDLVQNPKNIIWPYGHSIGIDSTGELRNYMQINNY